MKRNLPATEKFGSLAVPVLSKCTFGNFAARFAAPLAQLFRGGHVTRLLSPHPRPCRESHHFAFNISATSGSLFVWTPDGSTADGLFFSIYALPIY